MVSIPQNCSSGGASVGEVDGTIKSDGSVVAGSSVDSCASAEVNVRRPESIHPRLVSKR